MKISLRPKHFKHVFEITNHSVFSDNEYTEFTDFQTAFEALARQAVHQGLIFFM